MAKEPEKMVGKLPCPECHSTNTEILHGEGFLIFGGYNIQFDCLDCGYRATVSGVNQGNAWRNLEGELADSEVIIDNDPQYKKQELALYLDPEFEMPATCPFRKDICTYDCSLAGKVVNKRRDAAQRYIDGVYVCNLSNGTDAVRFLYSKEK